jgi:RNA polymerase sigma-70 factor (ECF subfamily)
VIILFYLADQPVRDIAEQEGVADGTVKSWLRRGRALLATQLADKEQHHG